MYSKLPLITLSIVLFSIVGVQCDSSLWGAPTITNDRDLDVRANGRTMLSNGTGGRATGRIGSDWQWQSTGVLFQGCTDDKIHITDCFGLQLSADTTKNLETGLPEGATPRQRIEFLPNAGGAAGETYQYEWKFYLSSQTGTTKNFFHLMQLLNRKAQGIAKTGPVITLDARSDQVQINDVFMQGCSGSDCPSIPLADFEDRTTLHRAMVTYGENGHFLYVIQDADHGNKELLRYEVSGNMGSDGSQG
ncbi:hypothetical protein VKT23_009704 [Stygiomarasmius scandens]|uniref:Uncharacterized protein n=1 Tax=Marasmiellus scandens TaxID=2682957 RepID=A0ABR1JFK7_9AGAR